MLLLMFVVVLFFLLVFGGWLFLLKKIFLDFSKISLLKGIGWLFFSEYLVEIGKMMVKLVVVLVMLWISLCNNFVVFFGL